MAVNLYFSREATLRGCFSNSIAMRFPLFLSSLLFFIGLSANALTAQGLITGQIIDETGDPLPGAHVYVVQTRQVFIADKQGVYRIEELTPGLYELHFSFVGYQTVSRKTKVVEGTSKTILHVQLTNKYVQLEGLEVRALRPSEEAPFTTTTVSAKDIATQDAGRDIPFLLQQLPSLIATSDAGTGIGYTDMRIRGVDATRINVTINGIPLNDAESQKVYWVDLPDLASSVRDIQIQRGAGASTNGTGAFGANININTLQKRTTAGAELRLSGGSFNTRRATLALNSGLLKTDNNHKENNGFFFHSRLSLIQSDGYIDRATADLRSYYLESGYQNKQAELRLIAFGGHERTYQAWYGVPAERIDDPEQRTYNPAGTEKPGDPYPDEVDDYTQHHFQALYKQQLNNNLYLNLAGHYTRGFGFYEQYKANELMSDYGLSDTLFCPAGNCRTDLVRRRWLDNHFFGTTWAFHYTNNATNLRLIYGGAANKYLGDHFGEVIWAQYFGQTEKDLRYYENDATKQEINNYLKLEYRPRNNLLLYTDLQSRRVNYDFQGKSATGNEVPQSVKLHFFNPKAGISWLINDKMRTYASVAFAQREPNRNDYVDSSPESRPKPEKLTDFELGFRQTGEKFRAGITLYYMHYRDQLALTGQINDVGEYTRINIPQSFRRGIELEGQYRLGAGFSLSLNTTLSDNRIVAFDEFIDSYSQAGYEGQEVVRHENTPLAFSPSFIFKSRLEWDKQLNEKKGCRLKAMLFSQYVSRQHLDNSGSSIAIIAPYFVHDLQISWSRPLANANRTTSSADEKQSSIHLFLQINNLFNTLYSANGWVYKAYMPGDADFITLNYLLAYYPQATRHFFGGVQLSF